jgi:RNA polymerase sigma factor (sigma-70 family)
VSQKRDEFRTAFQELFDAHFQRILRFLHRLSDDPDLAADLAQEAFVRLYRRGSVPDAPEAWLITVVMNLYRNARTTASRRRRLLAGRTELGWRAEPPPSPEQDLVSDETRRRVRAALDRLPERERSLLLLRAEGYSYRDLGRALGLREASVGQLLRRAREQFKGVYAGRVND